jgi:hypothetical protein
MSTLRQHVTHTKQVRFHLDGNENGNLWIDARIVDGNLEVKANDRIVVLPEMANVVTLQSLVR